MSASWTMLIEKSGELAAAWWPPAGALACVLVVLGWLARRHRRNRQRAWIRQEMEKGIQAIRAESQHLRSDASLAILGDVSRRIAETSSALRREIASAASPLREQLKDTRARLASLELLERASQNAPPLASLEALSRMTVDQGRLALAALEQLALSLVNPRVPPR